MKGGKRLGAGRPPAPPNVLVRIRLSPAQHSAYVERGADIWLKRVLGEVQQSTASQSVQLTDQQIEICVEKVWGSFAEFDEVRLFTRAIEAALTQATRSCNNDECEWEGQTDRMLGAVGPLCPVCGEMTEESE